MKKNIKEKNIENSEINVSRSTSNGMNKNQKGYAILFTIVIVSAVSVITAGLTNAVYKQLILSSLAKDSQSAFYQADTAGDCALYADQVEGVKTPPNITTIKGPWSCGSRGANGIPDGNNNLVITPHTQAGSGYNIDPVDPISSDPCFRINVTKTQNLTDPLVTDTKISAKGYNICDITNLRTVEREIQIDYKD